MKLNKSFWLILMFAVLFSACFGGGGSRTYPVSGTVVYETASGKPASGVRIQLTGATESEVITNAQGRWEAVFQGTGTATPSKEGFTFEPESITVSKANSSADFIARMASPAYTVSGTVKDQYGDGVSGATISFESKIMDYEPVTADAQGNWSKSGIKGLVTIVPSYKGYVLDPEQVEVSSAQQNIAFTVSIGYYNLSGSINDEDGKPIPGITVNFESESNQYSPAVTGLGGTWSSSRLEGKVVVRPVSDTYRFDPESVEVTSTGSVDFTAINTDFDGGTGSETAPFRIATAEHLNNVRNYLDKHFVLGADIDLSAFSDGSGWEPIGGNSDQFSGTFDGGGYTISNLKITNPEADYLGFFGYLNQASVSGLHLVNVDISGKNKVGALAGSAWKSVIEECTVSGTISGDYDVGGMVGLLTNSELGNCAASAVNVQGYERVGGLVGWSTFESDFQRCSAAGTVNGAGWVGGIAGSSESGALEYCYADVDITFSDMYAGGLVGYVGNGTIDYCYALGSVTSTDQFGREAGGLAGWSLNTDITDCFATGAVTGGNYVGGLVGRYTEWDDEPHIRNCYAVGQVTILTSSPSVGGLVGEKSAGSVIINSYYDSETTGQSDTGKGAPKTTEQMMQKDTFKYFRSDPLQGMVEISWEFDTIWDIDEGYSYPFLRELPNPYE
ncbi:MAG: GLUG motif-containing protein [Bacillota bacterium]|nr:GLUG motif-containing protein [Bacillota bacterium]